MLPINRALSHCSETPTWILVLEPNTDTRYYGSESLVAEHVILFRQVVIWLSNEW
jgi:hypothetical protein